MNSEQIAHTKKFIRLALDEDIGTGDLTAKAVPATQEARARLIAKQDIVLSGVAVAGLVLEEFGANARILSQKDDGARLKKGETILEMQGNARDLLTCERTILNILQRLCGVATFAQVFAQKIEGRSFKILDTRKTTPGLRYWEKKAVKDGGLHNHRARLDDGILIKENHIRAAGSISAALKNLGPVSVPLEVEVTNWAEAKEAVDHGATRLLLDNFSPPDLAELVKQLRDYKAGLFLEASGGVNLSTVLDYANTGVDAASIGALTHSVPAADLSLLFEFL